FEQAPEPYSPQGDAFVEADAQPERGEPAPSSGRKVFVKKVFDGEPRTFEKKTFTASPPAAKKLSGGPAERRAAAKASSKRPANKSKAPARGGARPGGRGTAAPRGGRGGARPGGRGRR